LYSQNVLEDKLIKIDRNYYTKNYRYTTYAAFLGTFSTFVEKLPHLKQLYVLPNEATIAQS